MTIYGISSSTSMLAIRNGMCYYFYY